MTIKKIAFGDFAEIQPNVPLKKGVTYPFIEMADVMPRTKFVVPGTTRVWIGGGGVKFVNNDVIFAKITPCLEHGKTAKVTGLNSNFGFGSTEFLVFRSRENISDSDYIYYLACSSVIREPAIKSMIGASGRQRAQKIVIENIIINAPEIEGQRHVASILSAYDNLIKNNRRRIQLLEQSARLLYKEWFVHLRFPGYEHTKMVDGVPEGWERKQIKHILGKVARPKKIQKTEYLKSGTFPCVDQSREFVGGYTEDAEAVIDIGKPLIVFGDHTRILKFVSFPFASGADGTQLVISNDEALSQEYLYFAIDAIDLSNYFYARHFKFLKDEYVFRPTGKYLSQFTEIIRPIMDQINILRVQSGILSKGRDLLLPRLMNGEHMSVKGPSQSSQNLETVI